MMSSWGNEMGAHMVTATNMHHGSHGSFYELGVHFGVFM